jgi:hypothetical protein
MKKFIYRFLIRKIFLTLVGILWMTEIYAVVPTTDVAKVSQDMTTMLNYNLKIINQLATLKNSGTDLATKVKIGELKSLQSVISSGGEICRSSTALSEGLSEYVNQVNNDLCKHFSQIIEDATKTQEYINRLSGMVTGLNASPQETTLALQKTVSDTQKAMQNTLTHIELLQVQQMQKQIAEEKLAKQNADSIYAGFKQSGL